MSLFRSEEMGHYNLVMPRESVWEILNELGELGELQFEDLNKKNPENRPKAIIEYIKRCEEMDGKL